MSFKTANPQVDGEMGQVFYSELAGHLFTARGSDEPGRISDRYFAREAQQRPTKAGLLTAGVIGCLQLVGHS